MKHKELDKEFKRKGFTFKQFRRTGDAAIYEKISKIGAKHYEVIAIGRHNGYELGGVPIEPAETYPSDSMWGLKGYTYKELSDAEKRFNSLIQLELQKKDKKSKKTVE